MQLLSLLILSGSNVGYYAASIGILTALLTSIYSWRLIFKTFHGTYENKDIKIDEMHESPLVMIVPLFILALGAIGSGYLFKELFIGYNSSANFWGNSIFFLEPLSQNHPPKWFILLTPILVVLTIPFSYILFVKNKDLLINFVSTNRPLYQFLKNKWYFDELYDFLFVRFFKFIGKFFWKKIDGAVIDKFGPDGISNVIKFLSNKAVKFQTGYVYQYAFVMLIGFSILLTILIVK